MLFDTFDGLLRVVVISLAAYAGLIAILRLSGKRMLSKLNAFDWTVSVAMGSTLATVLLSKQVALAEGLLAFVMLALLQWTVSRSSVASNWVARAVRSKPRLLLRDGEFCESAMQQERVLHLEVEQAIRSHGIGRIEDVAAVVLETDGNLSVIKRESDGNLTALTSVER
jgi:uncharacterized membrane protein YcaP (DUF421 family)